ncbi:hypothetical protein FEM48_Zijuj10G0108900 [Ziziphus jujuba var. spinosa]|uniref:DUF4283 domain-containing protein n=1 Tax=Ziziphus jujuba var. spinosa TaxID=714518 RepID=A0A978UMY6_ZIZJJ|nr:hypothetical protein FEM48_Zijuj10G0108900 [Ziziphus jujuba var. spinosa]
MEAGETSDEVHREIPQLELTASISKATKKFSLTLVGKIITEKVTRQFTVQLIVRRIWFTQEPVKVEQIYQNTFLFSFKKEADRDRVRHRCPWTISGANLALKEWNPHMSLRDFNFSHITFWVQIHGLSLQFMNRENAFKIGGLFEKNHIIKCEDTSRKSLKGLSFLRIQVEVNILKPLPTGHLKNSCKKIGNTSSNVDGKEYGVWLRAEDKAFLVFKEGNHLRKIENPHKDYFDITQREDSDTNPRSRETLEKLTDRPDKRDTSRPDTDLANSNLKFPLDDRTIDEDRKAARVALKENPNHQRKDLLQKVEKGLSLEVLGLNMGTKLSKGSYAGLNRISLATRPNQSLLGQFVTQIKHQ